MPKHPGPTSASLTPDEWRQLEPLVDVVLDAPPEQRAALLAELAGNDAGQQAELAALVAECDTPLPLLDQSAAETFAGLFDDARVPDLLANRYRLRDEVGRGGMATVYVARDIRHGRDVAVKILRGTFSAALGRQRFLREIEIVAQLRHPHIVPLYDSGDADGLLYYVMPYEEGRSLRQLLARQGALPVAQVLAILRDICDALAYAHVHGVVHRDIKPDNVLLSGRHATVTDFGIARAVDAAADSATITRDGLLLGTPAYMAPEQVAGESDVDHRADLYAVGVLAYELLAGRPPFSGESAQQVMVAHLSHQPAPLSSLRSEIPDALAALVMRCLEKLPAARWQTADELLTALEPLIARGHAGVTETSAAPATHGSRLSRPARAIRVALGVGVLAVVATFVVILGRDRTAHAAFSLGAATRLTADPGLEVQPTVSPDGRHVAYAAGNSLRTHILVRPVAGGRTIPLTNDTTENEWFPHWSPDGSRILYLSRGGVFSAPAFGGPARQEIPTRSAASVTTAVWSRDGKEIAFVRADSLLARDLATGNVRLIATGNDLHSCSWSPTGERIACVSGNSFYGTVGITTGGAMFGNLAPSQIVLVSAAGGKPVAVTDSTSLHQSPAWGPDGRTLYYVSNHEGTRDVYAQRLDRRGRREGAALRLTTGVGAHSVTFTADGSRLVYAVYGHSANVWSVPIPGRSPIGQGAATPVTSGNQTVEGVRISGDRRWLVFDSDLRGNSDVYRVSLAGGEPERLTSSPVDDFRGVISPDGKELAYHTFEGGTRNVFLLPLDGGPPQPLTSPVMPGLSMPNWSSDGTALTFFHLATSRTFVMRRDVSGRWSTPRLVARDAWRPDWSPDGRQIVFVSATSGRIGIAPADSGAQRELYVPSAGDPRAELAIFSEDGREVYFKSHDEKLRASFWSVPAGGGRPRLLVRFDDPVRPSNRFDFASDGRRFYFTIEDRQSDIWIADVTRP